MMGSLPDFLVLGAHKSGTSWLFQMLNAHPEIKVKEKIDYFLPNKEHRPSLDGYKAMFSKENDLKLGDLSTTYLFDKAAAPLIAQHHPGAKLVAIVRQPADRAFSHFRQDLKTGMLAQNVSFEQALTSNPQIKRWGCYKDHFEVYFDYFQRDQIHVILYEDIREHPQQVLASLYGFLEVDAAFYPTMADQVVNPARMPRSVQTEANVRKLGDRMQSNRWGRRLWKFVKTIGGKAAYHKINTQSEGIRPEMNPRTRQELLVYYRDDIAYIKQLINRPQLNWDA